MDPTNINQQTNDQNVIKAVNSVRHIGEFARIIGILNFALSPLAFLPYMLNQNLSVSVLLFIIAIAIAFVFFSLGKKMIKQPPYDDAKKYLITTLVISLLLSSNILALILAIMTIIALTKLNDYQRWSDWNYKTAQTQNSTSN